MKGLKKQKHKILVHIFISFALKTKAKKGPIFGILCPSESMKKMATNAAVI